MPFSTISSTCVSRMPASSATASPGSRYTSHIIGFLHMADAFLQKSSVIILPCYMMAAAEVYPLHMIKIITELLFHCFQCLCQCIRVLLAQSVKMNSVQARGSPHLSVPAGTVPPWFRVGKRARRGRRWHGLPGWSAPDLPGVRCFFPPVLPAPCTSSAGPGN